MCQTKKRVVVTGMGVLSPIGCGTDMFCKGLINGISGISYINRWDPNDSHSQLAGQILDFDPLCFFKKRCLKSLDRFSQLGIASAQLSLDDAGLSGKTILNEKSAVYIGTGIGGISTYEESLWLSKSLEKKRKDRAYAIPRIMNNATGSGIASRFGITGPNYTINTACASGASAIGLGFLSIRNGIHEIVICGGTEAPLSPGVFNAWSNLRVLSKNNEKPELSCQPFDKNRTGFVLSEGAAVCCLESLDSALKRDAGIYAEVIGYATNCNADHLTAPNLKGQVSVIQSALDDANILHDHVDYINAHGTATRLNDQIETDTIKAVFGNHAYQIPISATKSMTGHAMGASSAIEIIATVLAVKNSFIPPTINYKTKDPECDLDWVPNVSRVKEIDIALTNSFAFGGVNTTLVLKKW